MNYQKLKLDSVNQTWGLFSKKNCPKTLFFLKDRAKTSLFPASQLILHFWNKVERKTRPALCYQLQTSMIRVNLFLVWYLPDGYESKTFKLASPYLIASAQGILYSPMITLDDGPHKYECVYFLFAQSRWIFSLSISSLIVALLLCHEDSGMHCSDA